MFEDLTAGNSLPSYSNDNFGFDFTNQGPQNYVNYADPIMQSMNNQQFGLKDFTQLDQPKSYVSTDPNYDPRAGTSAQDVIQKILKALSAVSGATLGNASKLPFGTPQGPQLAGAPRAYDFNTPAFGGKTESPIDYASKGSAEFMRFLSFLKQISPMLYGDQGMRMQGRG